MDGWPPTEAVLPCARQLPTDAEALDQGLVPFRASALQIVQQTPAPGHHRQQSPPRVMILLVRLEVFLQQPKPLAEQSYLYLWRSAVRLVPLVLADHFLLYFGRQCHSRIDTPRLTLIFFFCTLSEYTHRTCRRNWPCHATLPTRSRLPPDCAIHPGARHSRRRRHQAAGTAAASGRSRRRRAYR